MSTQPTRDDAEDLRSLFEDTAPVILVDPEPVIRRGRRRRAVARAGVGLGAIAVVLAVVLMARPDGGTSGPVADTPPPPEPTRPVAIQVVPEVVQPGDVVTAVLMAGEENDLTFGIAAEVDRWDGDAWRRVGVTALCLVEWSCVGTVTDRLGGVEDIGLGAAPGQPGSATVLSTEGLTDGWYRLVQRAALDDDLATGVFEVRSTARAAPPLPAQDEVRLTVQPALVPPEGGLARVVTEVPPDADGNLSAEDIEQVDAQLDRSALVQRWDREEWLDVDEVPVLEREPDLGVEWGSPAVLPPLPEGSYRVVRARAGGSALWGVFTVSAGAPALEQPEAGPDATPDAEPDLAVEDVYAPDHPYCGEQPGQCLLETWWRDVVAAAGIERGGGDHTFGPLLSDSVRVDDQRSLMLTLFPAEAAPQSTTQLAVESTAYVGDVEVTAGRWEDGAYGRRLTCGGFVVQTWSTRVEPSEIDHIVGLLASGLTDCPADLTALAARYPEFPPVP